MNASALSSLDFQALQSLRKEISGDIRWDRHTRTLYATDASIYQEMPCAVCFPRDFNDIKLALNFCNKEGISAFPRGAGTSLAGQTVGGGLCLDLGRYMHNILEIDPSRRLARVEPGVIQGELNRVAAAHGLVFGPDTSTANRAMIGGMVGNNSCGSRSIHYGTTREHLLEMTASLSSGELVHLSDWGPQELAAILEANSKLGNIVRGLKHIVDNNKALIAERFPRPSVTRRNTGYALDYLAQTVITDGGTAPLNLARFLAGSEGTLAIMAEATLSLTPLPNAKGMFVGMFDSLSKALEASVRAVSAGPSAVELVDDKILAMTESQIAHRHNRFFIEGSPAAILIVEFFGENDEAVSEKISGCREALLSDELSYACPIIAPQKMEQVWALRRAGLGLLMGMKAAAKPLAFVEDSAVAVTDLPNYIARFEEIIGRYNADSVFYGHASVGELHLRPVLDLGLMDDRSRMENISQEVAELVREFGGALSGEHGDGRVRSPYIETVMGSECVALFKQVKGLWDPKNILNPGKIVNPAPLTDSLRAPSPPPVPPKTHFRFEDEQGILGASARCNGAGACRKLPTAGGTMCPSYHVTLDETHSTRGRANLFRALLSMEEKENPFDDDDLYEAMSLCLSCKACQSECPASVDMAKLKSEFLQHYWDANGAPLSALAMGFIARFNRFAQKMPRLSNALLNGPLLGQITKTALGVDRKRRLPALARTSFRTWFRHRQPPPDSTAARRPVVLFIDEFTDMYDPHIGQAAVSVLEALGFEILAPNHVDSGRPLLSKGFVRAAANRANKNVSILAPFAEKGIPILGLEPSAALTLSDEYPDLVDLALRSRADSVADKTLMVEDFIASLDDSDGSISDLFDDKERTILVHGHCHYKARTDGSGIIKALSLPGGHQVSMIPSGCCGMAGSFGYEQSELSLEIGGLTLFPAIKDSPEQALVSTSGFSCRHQIKDGTDRHALHPIEILNKALVQKSNTT